MCPARGLEPGNEISSLAQESGFIDAVTRKLKNHPMTPRHRMIFNIQHFNHSPIYHYSKSPFSFGEGPGMGWYYKFLTIQPFNRSTIQPFNG
jgi:hypothetical protein